MNAWTSVGYLVAAVLLVVAVARGRSSRPFTALAGVVAVEPVGSWLYHGHGGELVQFLHDVPLVGVLGFVAGWHVGRLGAAADVGALIGVGLGASAGAIVAAAAPGGTNVAGGVLTAMIAVASLIARQRGMAAVWTAPLLVLLAVATAAWIAGSDDSPLCDTDSLAQPHGLWHVLSALAIVSWAARASPLSRMRGQHIVRELS